jgi:pilus assembly protein FimV
VHNSKIKRISLAVCLALLPFTAGAAGLGKLTVLSGLGEPLNAEIELLAATKEELSSLSAVIAPDNVYAEQGIDRAAALNSIRVELTTKPDGGSVLRLVSSQPVNDPFLDMLIQVEWSNGRLLREYTALLDPPGYNKQEPASTATSLPEAGTTAGQVAAMPGKTPHKTAAAHAVEQPESETDHKVRSGDTLHAIATHLQPAGVSLEQMLVGLYRKNKDAFAGENMNRLKVGKILRVPAPEELQAIPQQEAANEIRVQVADWNAYRTKLAGAVADSEGTPEESQSQSASGKITAPVEDKAATESAGPRDVVKLSKSDASTSKDIQERIHALQEEATARENAVKEANDRVAILEKQIQDMQKLLQIKNQTLSEMQKTAPAMPKPAEPAKPSAQAQPEVQKPAEPKPEVQKPAEPKPEAQKPAEPKPMEPKPAPAAADKPAGEKPKSKKPLKPRVEPPKPEPEPGLMEDPLILGGGAAALIALLGGAWFYTRSKKRRGLDSFEQGILTSGGLKPNTVFGNTSGGTVDTGDSSFNTDFSQSGIGGMIDTNDVDPIAEAEVYMAYGRDVQAEEILKDALAKDPKRFELQQKLLEIYANRKDNAAFETLAGELYSTLGSGDPQWAKVAELGRKLEPDNPLYSANDATSALETVLTSGEDAGSTMQFKAPEVAADQDASLDFSLGTPSEADADPAKEDNSLDFDISAFTPEAAQVSPSTEQPDSGSDEALEIGAPDLTVIDAGSVSVMADNGLDFQFELPEPAAADNIQLDTGDLTVDADTATPEPVISSEEAFLDMALPALDLAEPANPAATLDASALDLSLDFPETSSTDTATNDIEAAAGMAPDLDLSLPAMEELPDVVATEPAMADFDPGKTLSDALPDSDSLTEEIVFDVATGSTDSSDGGLDFNFDAGLDDAATSAEIAPVTAVPDLDLSGISLDLGELAEDSSSETAGEEITLSGAESADVDTKLDLVTAYIDMGDTEGARELLEEVMREGGPQQRQRAQGMLDTLG